jgi:dihydrofolate synthase/folylpolyglutamate synthase
MQTDSVEKATAGRIDPLTWYEDTQILGSKPGLGTIRRLLELMGDPERSFTSIHVTGTNGKGSTAAITASIIESAGYRVGLFTSPHLSHFTESVRVNGEPIHLDAAISIIDRIRVAVDEMLASGDRHPTQFEILTALAFQYFADAAVDYAVVEVGMGGVLDATNVIEGKVFVITNVSLEHTQWLGDTVEKIAEAKAGIIKRGGVLVTAVTQPSVLRLLEDICRERECKMLAMGRDTILSNRATSPLGQKFTIKTPNNTYPDLETPLLGSHQAINAACGVTAAEALTLYGAEISEEAVYQGLRDVRWPGRLEIVQNKPLVVLDGAKDLEAVKALVKAVEENFTYRKLTTVISISSDKNIQEMIACLAQITDKFIVTRHRVSHRSADTDTIAAQIRHSEKPYEVMEKPSEAIEAAINSSSEQDMVLITGSVFFAGEARELWHPPRL